MYSTRLRQAAPSKTQRPEHVAPLPMQRRKRRGDRSNDMAANNVPTVRWTFHLIAVISSILKKGPLGKSGRRGHVQDMLQTRFLRSPITRYRRSSRSPATRRVYASMFRAPQWHGATQTHFHQGRANPHGTAVCPHTIEAVLSHDTANHPAHQQHAAFTPACFVLPSGTAPRKRTFHQGRANPHHRRNSPHEAGWCRSGRRHGECSTRSILVSSFAS